jgi:O-acetyl-ADP-ribose deacetylase (regulator of RNase III)
MNSSSDTFQVGAARVQLLQGDITQQDTDAIVNAANSSLMGGGGVDGAIHRAGGPAILEECKQIVTKIGRCETSEAVITSGGNLRAKYVIHTVGPVYRGGRKDEAALLENTYRNSLRLAADRHIGSISFPSISTGAFGYPIEEACEIALRTVFGFVKDQEALDEVRFVLFSDSDMEVYRDVAPRVHGEVTAG